MNAPILRPYQSKLLDDIAAAIAAGYRRILVVLPTGGGKTVVFAAKIQLVVAALGSALMIAHRREIIHQASNKLRDVGVPHGIIMAGEKSRSLLDVQVASVQTLFARGIRREVMDLPPATLGVIDEAHHTPAKTYQQIVEAYPDTVWLGCTATPERGDGRGLGGFFEVIIEGPQVEELIELGFLVPTRMYAAPVPDLHGVKTVAGDYVKSQLEERMDKPRLIGDIVTHWLKYGEGRRTVVFASGVGHSVHIRDEFSKAGVKAAHIDGDTPKDERDAILAQLARGEITVLSNCMVLTEGWDCCDLGCIVLARPTKSMGLYRQMGGRGLRPAPGKSDVIIIDHAGCVYRHGFLEDRVEWTLAPDKPAGANKAAAAYDGEPANRIIECTKCSALRTAGEPCTHCGFIPIKRPHYVVTEDGDLSLVDRERRVHPSLWSTEQQRHFYAQLVGIAEERNFKSGWASHKFREKFGVWPRFGDVEPIAPSAEVCAWVRSRYIAWKKARAA